MKGKNIKYVIVYCWMLWQVIPGSLLAQDLRYKDIYPYIESRNFIEAVPRLKDFLKIEPDHPSANLQLAMIFEERYKNYHPILQYNPALKNAENAKTYFLKAGLLVDEKEVKRNGKKFYTNFARIDNNGKLEVTYQDVKARIDSAYIQIDLFLRNMPGIYENFTRAVSCYDRASRNFALITGKYNNLKDLYLLYNNDLASNLGLLKVDYDSCLYYLKNYLDATRLYPALKYSQTYTALKIENFRLDGLQTYTDFLAQQISIWDYGTWVDQVNNMVNNDIKKLNTQLFSNEDRLDKNLKLLSDPPQALQIGIKPSRADADLILKLRNYDHNSLIVPLLRYQEEKQDLLFRALHEFELQRDSIRESPVNLLTYYSQLFAITKAGDSLVTTLKTANNDFNKLKHADFISRYYNSNSGFDQFVSGEEKFTADRINDYAAKIKNIIIENQVHFDDTLAFATWKKMRIPLFINYRDTVFMKPEIPYTSLILASPDSSLIVAGSIKPKKSNGSFDSFLAKVSPKHTTLWMTMLSNGEKDTAVVHNLSGALAIVPEGYAVMINAEHAKSHFSQNQLRIIGESGNMVDTIQIAESDFPRAMIYNESDGTFLAVLKGNRVDDPLDKDEPVRWIKFSRESSEVWKNQADISGDVAAIVSTQAGFILFGNYTRIRDTSGKVFTVSSNPLGTAAYALGMDNNGNVSSIRVLPSSSSYFISAVRKISDDNINLLGIRGNYIPFLQIHLIGESALHFILNSNLQVLYSQN